MISQDRQLEIAKEVVRGEGRVLVYGSDEFIQRFAARIEAEVIARMEPVYQIRRMGEDRMVDCHKDAYETKPERDRRILYRLPDEVKK